MDRQAGSWAIPQVKVVPAGLTATGMSYVAALYRCPTCGTLELVDEEADHGGA